MKTRSEKKNSGLNGILFIILLFFVIYCYLCLFMFGIMFGFKVVAHLEDDSVGGLQNSITRMLQADPDFGEFILSKFFIIIPNCCLVQCLRLT